MSRAIRAELLKVRTMRVMLVLVAGALAVTGIYVVGLYPNALTTAEYRAMLDEPEKGALFALIAGIVITAGEIRHGTLATTLVAIPSRGRVLLAKAVTAALAGAVIAVIVMAATLGMVIIRAHLHPGLGVGRLAVLGAATLSDYVLMAILGVGVGALARNQLIAVGLALAWFTVGESAVTNSFGMFSPVLPQGAADIVVGDMPDAKFGHYPVYLGVGVLVCYVAVFLAGGYLVLRRSDVT